MKPDFVLDCSVALAVCLQEEKCDAALRILRLTDQRQVIAASIFPLELVSAMVKAIRRNRIGDNDALRFIKKINRLNLLIAEPIRPSAMSEVFGLAQKHQLSAYDASYLQIAIEHYIPLATFDRALAAAADAEGLPALSLPEPC